MSMKEDRPRRNSSVRDARRIARERVVLFGAARQCAG